MDLFATRFTTPIDVRFVPALRGTLQSASWHWPERSTTFALVIAMWPYALRIFVLAIELGSAIVALAATCARVDDD